MITVEGQAPDQKKTACYDIDVEVDDTLKVQMNSFLLSTNSQMEIQNLDNIGLLSRLRFLDVSGNQITNITPLEALPELSGINLANNQIVEIGPLFNLPSLTNVLLEGNSAIPCSQLRSLEQKLERTFSLPPRCSP